MITGAHRIAIELELSMTGRRRLEAILAGYRAEPSITAVLYLVDDDFVAETVHTAAAKLGISARVHVLPVHFPERRKTDRAAALDDAPSSPTRRSRARRRQQPVR